MSSKHKFGSAHLETTIDNNGNHIAKLFTGVFSDVHIFQFIDNRTDGVLSALHHICYKLIKSNRLEFLFYVHDLNYVGMFLLSSVIRNNLVFDAFLQSSNIFNLKIHLRGCCLEFRCFYKLFPKELKDLSAPLDLDLKKENRSIKNSRKILKLLSLQICQIILHFLTIIRKKFLNLKIDVCSVLSISSLALKIFEKKFNPFQIKLSGNELLGKYLLNSYYGGRCEVYGNRDIGEKIIFYDFEGMYGLCMKEPLPWGNWTIVHNPTNFDQPGFYFIKYNSEMPIPVLPHRSAITGKLIFPNGKSLSGWHYFEEINYFISLGGEVISASQGIVFDKFNSIFEEYVSFFDQYRANGGSLKFLGKLLVNSLYGRLGMKERSTHTFFVKADEFVANKTQYGSILSVSSIGNYLLIETEKDFLRLKQKFLKKNNFKNNLSLAAAITAKARIRLHNDQMRIEKLGGRMLYSDTDSIFAAFKKPCDYEAIAISLFPHKVDFSITDAIFINPKSYGLTKKNGETEIKIKGLPSSAVSFEKLKGLFFSNKTLTIGDFSWTSKKGAEFPITQKETRRFNLNMHDKRIFSDNKLFSFPVNNQ